MKFAKIKAIDYHLPESTLSNEDLSRQFPEWSVDKIASKTGINSRRIASSSECSSDLAVAAANKLFQSDNGLDREQVDFLIFCTQTPDYFLPTTACILQDRLGLPTSIGAFDFNLGCSGYVYGLGLGTSLIESGQAENVLLLTGDTYSKLLAPEDRSVRAIFGDGASATWLSAQASTDPLIGPFVYGTDGAGYKNLIVESGAMRDQEGTSDRFLRMNGSEIFTFTISAVPKLVNQTLEKAGLGLDDIDWFIFHQANAFMMEHLRKKLDIPANKFVVQLDEFGNTVASSIPIAITATANQNQIKPGQKLMTVGFGVGYSWAATIITW